MTDQSTTLPLHTTLVWLPIEALEYPDAYDGAIEAPFSIRTLREEDLPDEADPDSLPRHIFCYHKMIYEGRYELALYAELDDLDHPLFRACDMLGDRAGAGDTSEPAGQPDGAPATQPLPFSLGLSGPAYNMTTELRFTQPGTGRTAVVAFGSGSLEDEYLAFGTIKQILNDHWAAYPTADVVIGDYALLVPEARS